MKKLFKIISLKIQQFIWKRYYYSLPLQYKNVTILEGLSLQLHEQRNESDKLSKTLTKVFNEFQKKIKFGKSSLIYSIKCCFIFLNYTKYLI